MFQRFPIRRKLALALAVPLVALLAVAVFEAWQARTEADDIGEQANLARATTGPGSPISNIENERNATAIYLLGFEDFVDLQSENLEGEAYPETDEAIAAFEDAVDNNGSSRVREVYGPLVDEMSALQEIRDQVTGYTGARNSQNSALTTQVFDAYTDLMAQFFAANREVSLDIDQPDLRRGAQLVDLGLRQSDLTARLVMGQLLATLTGDGLQSPQEVTETSAELAELDENATQIETLGSGDYRSMVDNLLATEHIQQFREIIQRSLETGLPNLQPALAAADGPSADENGYTVFHQAVEDELNIQADDLETAAELRFWLFLGLALAVVLAALIATLLVSLSITRPLRSLTRQATDMAQHRLPDAVLDILDTPLGDDVAVPDIAPVTVKTRDEVADVADALNTVQDSALDLAVEQAVLRRNIADSFVNLGRRNQNLLGRQLDFITELEHNETDPDTLANLFRLDHLATRMRRNAESLLVLAGIDPPRKWAAPVRITDAIRAALGEVEDYQRVTVRAVEPTTIMGSAAADLAHLMAELIENALIFSPPDQTVEIRGRVAPNGYTLAVVDSGLGMPPDELARANRRLAGAESFTIAPSKYLGHYVAGNLAARHNINVQLHNSPGHGITATINVPPALLTGEQQTAFTPGPRPGDGASGAPQFPPAPVPAPSAQPEPVAAPPPPPPPSPSPARVGASSPFGDWPASEAPLERPAWLDPVPSAAATDAPVDDGADEVPLPSAASELRLDPLPPAVDPAAQASGPAQTSSFHQRLDLPPSLPQRNAPPAARQPDHTPSGLARRAPAIPTRGTQPGQSRAATPSDDLLQTLATYTTHLHRQIDPNRPPTPPSGAPTTPPPSFNPTPVAGSPPVRPGFPPAPGSSPDGAHATPTTHGAAPEHTPSGLARRVAGAQLPQAQPIGLHRHSGEVPAVGRSRATLPQRARENVGGRSNRDQRAADQDAGGAKDVGSSDANADARTAKDVYSFLSSFSAGVQRGLDEAGRSSTTSEEDQ